MQEYIADTALGLVKTRLNKLAADTTMDEYLILRIQAAAGELEKKGITLTDSAEDLMLVVDLAVWQYQNRDSREAMPQWMRDRLRERWMRA